MGRKPKQYKYVKENDGRRNNGRKPGVRNVPVVRPTSSAAINNAKRNRIGIYALNAMAKAFGSEEAAWESLAEQAKQSFPHLKLLFEYKYGKPLDAPEEKQQKVNINIKNLFTGTQEDEKTIELDADEETSTESEV
tara:strand:- start:3273 stop:3680 length:408 start_codon:yes stop_codon:yes gene_type:complete